MAYKSSRGSLFNILAIVGSIIAISLIVLTVNLVRKGIKVDDSSAAGTCFPLKYPCYEGLVNFPQDEGKHANKQAEWWYVNFNNSSPELAGAVALVRANPGTGDRGFMLLEITNEAQGTFYYRVLEGSITSNQDFLNITFTPTNTSEISLARLYQQGNPFSYKFEVVGPNTNINLSLASQKRPLVEGGDGYVPIFANSSEESGYYSLTRIQATGSIALPGASSFSANSKAWMDHQWFNVPGGFTGIDPSTMRPHHEWFSVQLDNNVEIVGWQIFRETPSGLVLALQNLDILDASNNQIHHDSFDLDPKTFWTSPEGQKFAKEWRMKKDSLFDIRFQTSVANQFVDSWNTYEGSVELTSGTYSGSSVDGEGFSEMTLYYLATTPCGSGVELCDSRDNDCDFRIDEMCTATSPTPTPRPTATIAPTPLVSCTVDLQPNFLSLGMGKQTTLLASITNSTQKPTRVTFSSSNSSVAKVSPLADYVSPYQTTLTGVFSGTATITAQVFLDNTNTSRCSDTLTARITSVLPTIIREQ